MRAVASNEDTRTNDLAISGEEMLGDLLLETHHPAPAAYQAALKEGPIGLVDYTERSRRREQRLSPGEAKRYYQRLLKICGPAADRGEIRRVKAYLEKMP